MAAAAVVITEADLLKSLDALAGKTAETDNPAPAPKIQIEKLAKSTREAIVAQASEGFRKAMDVSPFLEELVTLISMHNDASLQTLEKSIEGSAERDLTTVAILTKMNKTLEDLGAKIDKYGSTPGTAVSRITADGRTIVASPLAKTVELPNGEHGVINPRKAKAQIVEGLTILHKSLEGSDPGAASRMLLAITTVESVGTHAIAPELLQKAAVAYRAAHGVTVAAAA